MAVPKRRTSKSKKRMRKASHRTAAVSLRTDAKSGARHRGHCVDPKTGMYRGRQVLTVTAEE